MGAAAIESQQLSPSGESELDVSADYLSRRHGNYGAVIVREAVGRAEGHFF
jgi:hypothetical protein